jgi:hypothetical protein
MKKNPNEPYYAIFSNFSDEFVTPCLTMEELKRFIEDDLSDRVDIGEDDLTIFELKPTKFEVKPTLKLAT